MSSQAKELRLALGMRGGVSLCVWIGGTCREVEAMRASSPSATGQQPEPPLTTPFWRRLLTIGGIETVTVDVLSGASAGGLNGVIYAASRMYGFSMDELRQVWLSIGALGSMIRPAESLSEGKPYFPSLLEGDEYFFEQLYNQLQILSKDGKPPTARPRLDLSLTTTSVEPIHRGPAGSLEGVPAEPRFATTFRFRRRGGAWLDDFGTDADTQQKAIAQLALAGRATSSYPVAFEAAVVRALRPSSFCAGPAPMDERPLNVDMAGIFSDAGTAPFVTMDGGVLDNIPLGRAIDAIGEAPADRPTRRVLVYVCPGSPWAPTAEPVMDTKDRRTTWGVAQGAVRARVRPETIAADLAQLDRYHDRIARGRRIRELSFEDAVDRALTLDLAEAARDSYCRSRADADAQAVRALLDDPATVLGEDPFPSANWSDWVWRNPLARWSERGRRGLDVALAKALMVRPEGLVDLLHTPTAPIGRVARLLIELARFVEVHGATADHRAAAGGAKEALYRVLLVHTELSDRMQRLGWVVLATKEREDWAIAAPIQIARLSSISEDDADTVHDYIALGDETRLHGVRQSRLDLLDRLLDGDALPAEGRTDLPATLVPVMLSHLQALMAIALAPPDGAHRGTGPAGNESGQLLHRALQPDGASDLDEQHLAALDVLAFPENAAGAPGGSEIEFEILSAALNPSPLANAFPILLGGEAYGEDAWITIGERLQLPTQVTVEHKLAGSELQNFAAFLRTEWRANDWMWGRLDAVWTLVHVVLTPDVLVAAARRHLADAAPADALLAELRLAVTRFDGAATDADGDAWESFIAANVWDPVAEAIARMCAEAVAAAIDPTRPAPAVDQVQLCLIASRQWQILADELARQENDDTTVNPTPPTTPLTPRRAVDLADRYWVGKQTLTRPPVAADKCLVETLMAAAGETVTFNLQGRVPKRLAGVVQGIVGVLGWAWLGKRTRFKVTAAVTAAFALGGLLVPGIPAFDAGWSEPDLYWALAGLPGAMLLLIAAGLAAANRWIPMLILGLAGVGLVALAGFQGNSWTGSAAVIGIAALVLLPALSMLGRLRPR